MANINPYQRLLLALDSYLQKSSENSPTSFERDFGLPNGFFHNAEKRGTPDAKKKLYRNTYENIHNAQPFFNINWLETGEGEMWLNDETENKIELMRKKVEGEAVVDSYADFLVKEGK